MPRRAVATEYDYHADFIHDSRDKLLARREQIEEEMAAREHSLEAIDAAVAAIDKAKLEDPRR